MTSRIADARGAAVLETAIVLPLLVTMLFGIIQFGQLLGAHIALRTAAATAARAVVVNASVNQTSAWNYARSAMVYPLNPNSLTLAQVQVTPRTFGTVTGATVDLTYSFPLLISFVVPGSSGGSFTIRASATFG